MFADEGEMVRADVLTFRHKAQAGCQKCGRGQTGEGGNDFDDELERGLQARLLFQKEEWRAELKQELYQEVQASKDVG